MPETLTRTSPSRKLVQTALDNPVSVIHQTEGLTLYEFIEVFWDIVSEDKFKTNWHIKLLCEELETIAYRVAENKPKLYDLIVNIPPGTTKTTICSVMFPVWCWTKWYWMKFITASYSATLSLESAEKSRDIIRSEKFKYIYPYLEIKQDKDTKSNFRVIKKEQALTPGHRPVIKLGGTRFSTSVGATTLGFHGHILIVDDALNPKSEEVGEADLQSAKYWMTQVLPTRKTDKLVSTTVLIMQRLHQSDPSGVLLDNEKLKIRHICLPGEIRNYRKEVKPQSLIKYYKGDLLDPVRLNWRVLNELEAILGQYGYAGQVGQRPTPPGGGMFKVDNFMIVDSLPAPVNFDQVVRYWDKAGTAGGGAYTAGVKMMKTTKNYFYVIDVKRGQWSTDDRERIIRATAEADGADVVVYIEQEPGSGGKESAESTVRNLAGFACYPNSPQGDKPHRADPYSVQVNYGNVRLLRGDWNREYIEEFRYFPFSTYKDQVDASSGAFTKLVGKRQVRLLRSKLNERR